MPQRDYSHLTKADLIELVKQRDAQAHFGLVWERDDIEKDKSINDEFVGLDLVSELSHGSGPHQNFVIEGDNFDTLRHLLMTHAGRIDVCYIDPPYNTGSTSSNRKGWVYNDKFFDPNSRYRHSTWLEFMFPRLQLACDLLSDKGVLMVSIDDTELYNLKLLLDRVFGPKNFIGNIVWKNVTDNNPTRVAVEHEYILVYAKNKASNPSVWKSSAYAAKELLLQIGAEFIEKYSNQATRQKEYTKWYRENKEFLGPLEDYKFIDDGGIYAGLRIANNPGGEGYRYDVPYKGDPARPCRQPQNGYRFPPTTMQRMLDNNEIIFGKDENKVIEVKRYASVYQAKLSSVIELDGRAGPNELKAIFDVANTPFNNPKPTSLITSLLRFVCAKDAVVLDFFAGSGTTGHAVLNLNKEDGGTRKFILASSTEACATGTEDERNKNICRDICAERLRRVMASSGSGEFAYLRAKTILRHRLERELSNQTVWNAVSLAHRLPVTVLESFLGWAVTSEGVAVAYPTGTKVADVERFRQAADSHAGPVVCYAWAAARFQAAVPQAQVFSLPDALLANFRKSPARVTASPEQVKPASEGAEE